MNKQKVIEQLQDTILSIKDFPKKGIIFRDVTPLFAKPKLVNDVIDIFVDYLRDQKVDAIVGIESRGYLFGVPLALRLNKPFILIRKPNKLPRPVFKQEFNLEYGSSVLELQKTDIKPGWNVCVIDDLLATGGTIEAAEKLIHKAHANVLCNLFLIELIGLCQPNKIKSKIFSILKY